MRNGDVDAGEALGLDMASPGGGFQAGVPLAVHFVATGWGGGEGVVLRVRWLGGALSEQELSKLGRWITVTEPQGDEE